MNRRGTGWKVLPDATRPSSLGVVLVVLAAWAAGREATGQSLPEGAVSRLGSPPPQPAAVFAFSPDGEALATGGIEGTVRLWDARTYARLREFETHWTSVGAVAFAPDGRSFAAAGWDHRTNDSSAVFLWSRSDGAELRRIAAAAPYAEDLAFSPDGVLLAAAANQKTLIFEVSTGDQRLALAGAAAIAFSPDGRRLAAAHSWKTAKLLMFETTSGEVVWEKDLGRTIGSLAYSPDGRWLAVGIKNMQSPSAIALLDGETGDEIRSLEGHTDGIWDLAFSADGSRLASTAIDDAIRVWDPSGGGELLRVAEGVGAAAVAFSPDGLTLAAAGGRQHWVHAWDAATGAERSASHDGAVLAVAFAPGGDELAAASSDGRLHVWDVASGTRRLAFPVAEGEAIAVAWSPDGRTLATIGSQEPRVRLWNATDGQALRDAGRFDRPAVSLAFSADGTVLFVGCDGRAVHAIDVATGTEQVRLEGHRRPVTGLAVSAADGTVASGGWDGEIRLWSPTTAAAGVWNAGAVLPAHTGDVDVLQFSADGGTLLSAGRDDRLLVWSLPVGAGGQPARTIELEAGRLTGAALSPDGGVIAAAVGTRTLRRWQLEFVDRRGLLAEPDAVPETSLRLFEGATGRELRSFTGHAGGALCAAFSPDGRRIATGGRDGTVLVWDATLASSP
ncbi:MAG: PD40 domain-containing protein [Deltaproteobacteria bacterium]|nr:PD40 domain-containing protein [Deltaproteobacteria bacterium]